MHGGNDLVLVVIVVDGVLHGPLPTVPAQFLHSRRDGFGEVQLAVQVVGVVVVQVQTWGVVMYMYMYEHEHECVCVLYMSGYVYDDIITTTHQ